MHPLAMCRAKGWLHEYRIARTYPKGVLEVCMKCRKATFFRYDIPNHLYLFSHLRSALQPYQSRYYKEYGKRI